MSTKATLDNDYERMVPEFHKGTLMYGEHMTRYLSAQPIVKDKTILDIASGSGYGTKMLAEHAKKVYGVDVNENAIAYAKEHYGAKNIDYRVGDGEKIPLEDNSVDVVVTFETIEHIENYGQFIHEVNRVLKPDGIAIVSTPNDLEFAEGNHFHLHEFEYQELVDLLKKDFKYVDSYFQATSKFVAIGDRELFETEGPVELPILNMSPIEPSKYLYFYLLCSNRTITEKIASVGAIGEHYSDRQLMKEHHAVAAHVNNLEEQMNALRKQIEDLSAELHQVYNSKSYKAAKKLAKAYHKITK